MEDAVGNIPKVGDLCAYHRGKTTKVGIVKYVKETSVAFDPLIGRTHGGQNYVTTPNNFVIIANDGSEFLKLKIDHEGSWRESLLQVFSWLEFYTDGEFIHPADYISGVDQSKWLRGEVSQKEVDEYRQK